MNEKLKLLIIDDEPIVGRRLQPALTKSGHVVDTCEDPREALRMITERTYDIVVTDIRMGEISGLEVLAAVQQHQPDTKVIVISGYATMEVAREALAKGAFEVLAKPFSPEDLRRIIALAAQELSRASATRPGESSGGG